MKKKIVSILKKKWNKFFFVDTNRENEKRSRMEREIERELENLRGVSSTEKDKKNEDIKSMIKYYISLTEKTEDRRNHIYSSALNFITIYLAVLGLIFSLKQYPATAQIIPPLVLSLIIIILIVQIGSCVVIIFTHEFQTEFNYPFLELEEYGNKWKWFYYGNKHILRINTNPLFRKTFSQTTEPYMNGLKTFIHNYTKEKLEEEISDNAQQLYLLQVHNYYKNRFLLQLIKTRLWSMRIMFIIIFIVVVCYYLIKFVI